MRARCLRCAAEYPEHEKVRIGVMSLVVPPERTSRLRYLVDTRIWKETD